MCLARFVRKRGILRRSFKGLVIRLFLDLGEVRILKFTVRQVMMTTISNQMIRESLSEEIANWHQL